MSEAVMTLREIRVGLQSEQVADRSRAIRAMLLTDTERQAYRWALAYVPDLTMDTWGDWVKTAQEGS